MTKLSLIRDRIDFALGAGCFSILWFFSLSKGAGLFSEVLKKPKVVRVMNYGTSALMVYLGGNLLLSM